MSKIMISLAVVAAAMASSAPAFAAGQANGSMKVTLRIQESCGLSAETFALDPQTSEVRGSILEYCNASRCYQVLASHRPLEDGETVQLDFDSANSQLSASGLSPLSIRSGPRFGRVPVVVRSENLQAPIALSLSMTAI